ncbi:hypothetical protein RND81_11G118200 [Saponaria officinalis]|uniref:Auxin-responsive protein n=1 Tax=Saponaria officinalis TaxID=3572 RepID=A0AAW1HMP1_SAPOF
MGESAPKLLDFMVPKEEKVCKTKEEKQLLLSSSSTTSDENNKLELRLGLPCQDYYFNNNININYNGGGGIECGEVQKNQAWSSSPRCVKVENKAFSPNTSQKRAAPSPVVGWPPIRSFRKNLASSSSAKTGSDLQNGMPSKAVHVNEKKPAENSNKGQFVKINMDGIPIGRKVDLSAFNCYDNLSSAVDALFRGLLAAQKDSSAGGIENKHEEQKPITGILDRTGEYTLVYEDNEGDRMLVGDVPWHMFVSTVKRLRVLKSSDLPTLSRGSKECKVMVEAESK